MAVRKLKDSVYEVGVNHWDRDFFEDLTPLTTGTSYNSYYIKGSEKIALIDTVDPSKVDELFTNLAELDVTHIDYIISQHAEQDHSGSIPAVLSAFPMAKVVTNEKCKGLLKTHMEIDDDKFIIIKDDETLSLGDKTLKFIFAAWVHWPETMLTYLEEDKILFTCDFLGGHFTSSDAFVQDEREMYLESKLYYADIMMPFRRNIRKHLKRIEPLELDIIAPSHGQMYDDPQMIIKNYEEWISDDVKNLALIPYASTHDNVTSMVEYLVDALIKRGVNAKPYHLTRTDIRSLSVDLVDAATLVVGSPTFIMGPHPEVVNATFLVNLLRPKIKNFAIIGSYAWATKMVDVLMGMITNIKPNVLEPVISQGKPREEDFKNLDRLADDIAAKHKEQGIL